MWHSWPLVLFLLFSPKIKPLLGRKDVQAIPSPQAYTDVRGTQTYILNTQPKLVFLEHVPGSGRKLSCQMLRCPIAEEDLGWCQAGIIRTDSQSQTLSCIPGQAGGQRPPCFGMRDLAILQLKSMFAWCS